MEFFSFGLQNKLCSLKAEKKNMNSMPFKKVLTRKGKLQQVLTYKKPKFKEKKILIKQAKKKNISVYLLFVKKRTSLQIQILFRGVANQFVNIVDSA